MTCDHLLAKLDGIRPRGPSRWSALCPAHPDKSPSLSIKEGERGILLRCWAGCTVAEIVAALGLGLKDLFNRSPLPRGSRPTPRPMKLDRVAVAFRFDLAALDLRQRAEKICTTAKTLDLSMLDDAGLDRAMACVAQAHADHERAEMFEQVADGLRARKFRKDLVA